MSKTNPGRITGVLMLAFLLGTGAGCSDDEASTGEAAQAGAVEAGAGAEQQATAEEGKSTGQSLTEAAGVKGEVEAAPKVEKKNFVKLSGKTEWPDPTLQPRPAEIMPLVARANTLGVARSSLGYVAVGERGHILVSRDGADWTQKPSPSRSKLNEVWFETDNHGWAIGNEATILETRDGGETWELRHFDGMAEPLYDIIDLSRDAYLVVGRRGTAMISRDRGRSWEKIENDITDFQFHFFSITRLKDGSLWVTGETGFVIRLSDDAETWEKVISPYTGSLFGMLPVGRYGFVAYGLRGNVFVARNHFRLQPEDLDEYDEFDIENIIDEDELAAIGWEMIDSDTDQSLFGGTTTATGEVFLVGVNGVGVRSSQRVTAFDRVDLGINYSLNDVILLGSRALVVGKFGPAWVTMN